MAQSDIETYRKFAQHRLRSNAEGLRRLAAKYEQIADSLDTVPAPGRPTHLSVVQEIIHEHAVWLSNAHLEIAIEHAARADSLAEQEKRDAARA